MIPNARHRMTRDPDGTVYCAVCGRRDFQPDDNFYGCPGQAPGTGNYNDEQLDYYGESPAVAPLKAAHEIDLSPVAVNYVERPNQKVRTFVEVDDAPAQPERKEVWDMSLVEFAEFKGYKLGPWMKQQLQEIDEAGQRGLPNKG